ncbi:Efflux RND transporter periplasmic adaptor subunit [Planctomycetales bacterium 10988]|nr:Efflux RND transporter periplasmic adaptor subunit [Planctomycetales bacterium 10988]
MVEQVPTWRSRLFSLAKPFLSFLSKALLLLAVGVGLIAALGLAQRWGWIQSHAHPSESAGVAESTATYTCPMHPQIRQQGEGSCPICGMALVPASSSNEEDDAGEYAVNIDPAARRLIGIQTVEVQRKPVQRTIRSVGRIAYDEGRLSTIAAYVSGRIEKLYADYVGVPVNQGEDLALLYSPELYEAQVAYLSSLKPSAISFGGEENRDESLAEIARQNLLELGMTEQQIRRLREQKEPATRLPITSPQSGTVIEKHKVEGDYVNSGEPIYKVANLETVWLLLDLFPQDAATVRFGQEVEAKVQSLPGETFMGRVAFVDPVVQEKTQTVRVRVEFWNKSGKLRPGDWATARMLAPPIPQEIVYDSELVGKWISHMHPQIIRDSPGKCPICGMDLVSSKEWGYAEKPQPLPHYLAIPRDALLTVGENSVVYVEAEPGRFEIRQVETGPFLDREVIIVGGLREGEIVARNGNFLIDSQMQLAGKPSLINPQQAPRYPEGPLELPQNARYTLSASSLDALQQSYQNYFLIQAKLAADELPVPENIEQLQTHLAKVLTDSSLPADLEAQLRRADRVTPRLKGGIEESRKAFRTLSHALLKVAHLTQGLPHQDSWTHFFCPMVPGGGGDWLQDEDQLLNPYWGSRMLHCGIKVKELPEPAEEAVQ